MTGRPAASADHAAPTPGEEPFIERDDSLTRILMAVETLGSGNGRLVLISGEPGIGKTRLSREVLGRVSSQGARTSLGRCFEQHTAVPFFPFTEALTLPLVGLPLLPDPQALERWPELAHLLPEAGADQHVQGGQETQLRVFRAVTAFLRDVAEGSPLVLLLDDLHWADATSLSLLLYLGRHLAGSRILVLGTYREAEVRPEHALEEILRELVRDGHLDEVHLQPLDLEGTAGLVRQQLATPTISDELVALVHARAGGNPFFTKELLKALVEQGALTHKQSRWLPTVLAPMDVPRSVRSLVAHRVSQLPADAQELLRQASVVGQEVELDVLVAVSGLPDSAVLDNLDATLDAGLLKHAPTGSQHNYAFVHALMQQALYEGQPSSVRRRLHQRVGEVLELRHKDRPLVSAELARHFLAAGDARRALGYALQAGREASARYAHAEAGRWYQQAVDLLIDQGEHAQAAEAQYHVAGELYDLNRLTDALAAYHSALSTFERVADTLGQARVHRGIAVVHRGRYDLAAAVPHFEKALHLWPPERQDAELASLQVDAARASVFTGDFGTATALAMRAIETAERSDAPGLLALSLVQLAGIRERDDPRPRFTIEPLDRAERIAHVAGDWRALCYVYLSRASHYSQLSGELDKARADRRAAVKAAERSGDTERIAFAYQMLSWTHLDMGAWREGRQAARDGLALDPDSLLPGSGPPGAALLAWMEGRHDDALALMAAYVADARERHDVQGLSVSLATLADMALQLDRFAEAEAPAREAADLLRVDGGWRPWPGMGLGPLAETIVRLTTADAEQIVATAEREVAATEQYVAHPQLLRSRGLLLQRQGQPDAALEALRASAEIARSQHAGIQLCRTLDQLAAVARQQSAVAMAVEVETELVHLIESIGPEVSGLTWAQHRAPATRGRPTSGPEQSRPTDVWANPLTPREREVAVLLARGLTNRQIAEALVIAEGTAGVHVDHILNKLGFRSRAQVAAWAAEHGLLAAATD
jgi:DNA-binding NarL/FixJ family response regulator